MVMATISTAQDGSSSRISQNPKSRKPLSKVDLTVAWAIQSVARLGGYLSHRRKSNIGITVLWRGFLELQSLCEGWQLRLEGEVR